MIATEEQITSREELLTTLYKEGFSSVAAFVHKHGGTLPDAQDVFQEALIIYYEKVVVGSTYIEHDSAYLFGIARHLWYQKHKGAIQFEELDETILETIRSEESIHPSQEKLLNILVQAGKKCMDVLKAFYYDKLSMKKLSEQFGYMSERSATVQKYKCLEKVKDKVKENNSSYEDFLE